jgi:pimeloyl-ACP methyl ester carboxylesterase
MNTPKLKQVKPYRAGLGIVMLVCLLLMPVIASQGSMSFTPPQKVLILQTGSDQNTYLATQTLLPLLAREESLEHTLRVFQTFESLKTILGSADPTTAVVIIGHGTTSGLQLHDRVLAWDYLRSSLQHSGVQKTFLLACHGGLIEAPNVYGFRGRIDAVAGALLCAEFLSPSTSLEQRIAVSTKALFYQRQMVHPLGRILLFIHGYNTDDWTSWEKIHDEFESTGAFGQPGSRALYTVSDPSSDEDPGYMFFSYLDPDATGTPDPTWNDVGPNVIAVQLFDRLKLLPSGTVVDVFAHSYGGIFIRALIKTRGEILKNTYGITFGDITTIASPNQGTNLANIVSAWYFQQIEPGALVLQILSFLLPAAEDWRTFLATCVKIGHSFLNNLNDWFEDYGQSYAERWHSVGIVSHTVWANLAAIAIHNYQANDVLVASDRAQMPFDWVHHIRMEGPVGEDPNNGTEYSGIDHGTCITLQVCLEYYRDLILDLDHDGDWLSTGDELIVGSDPLISDTDGDYLPDGIDPNPTSFTNRVDVITSSDGNGYGTISAGAYYEFGIKKVEIRWRFPPSGSWSSDSKTFSSPYPINGLHSKTIYRGIYGGYVEWQVKVYNEDNQIVLSDQGTFWVDGIVY